MCKWLNCCPVLCSLKKSQWGTCTLIHCTNGTCACLVRWSDFTLQCAKFGEEKKNPLSNTSSANPPVSIAVRPMNHRRSQITFATLKGEAVVTKCEMSGMFNRTVSIAMRLLIMQMGVWWKLLRSCEENAPVRRGAEAPGRHRHGRIRLSHRKRRPASLREFPGRRRRQHADPAGQRQEVRCQALDNHTLRIVLF